MKNIVAEMMDVFFNGRPAPKDTTPLIRLKITREQLRDIENGKQHLFEARNGTRILVVLKPAV